MSIGTTKSLSPFVELISTYGGDAPGFYLRETFKGTEGAIIAGPFVEEFEALGAFHAPNARREYPIAELFDPYVMLRVERIYVGHHVRVDSFAKLEGGEGLWIGDDVHIASFTHIGIGGGKTILADGSSFASGAKVISGSNIYGAGHGCSAIAPGVEFKRGMTIIGKNATVYTNAVVTPGVWVGENAVILPGAVVTTHVPANQVWGGTPARYIKDVR